MHKFKMLTYPFTIRSAILGLAILLVRETKKEAMLHSEVGLMDIGSKKQ